MEGRSLGTALLSALAASCLYYGLWVVATPFIHPAHSFLDSFPRREYALILPACLITFGVLALYTYMSALLLIRPKNATTLADR